MARKLLTYACASSTPCPMPPYAKVTTKIDTHKGRSRRSSTPKQCTKLHAFRETPISFPSPPLTFLNQPFTVCPIWAMALKKLETEILAVKDGLAHKLQARSLLRTWCQSIFCYLELLQGRFLVSSSNGNPECGVSFTNPRDRIMGERGSSVSQRYLRTVYSSHRPPRRAKQGNLMKSTLRQISGTNSGG